jgi:hypothetical protein
MVCAAFFEQGFGLPSHLFLRSLLWSYGLELHHLTPSGTLHMAAFVTLCGAYIGIEPSLNPWSDFFLAWLQPNSGTGMVSLGSADILVRTGPGYDAYFSILQPDSSVGWRKVWFLLKNEADVPLSAFIGGCPNPHPNSEHGVTWIDLPGCSPYWRPSRCCSKKG